MSRAPWSARLALVGFLGSDFVHAVRARRSFEPDVVHAHWWFPNGVVGTWLGGLAHIPLVTTLHGTDVRLARSVGVAKPLFGHVLRHSAAVTTVSHWLKEETEALVPGRQSNGRADARRDRSVRTRFVARRPTASFCGQAHAAEGRRAPAPRTRAR